MLHERWLTRHKRRRCVPGVVAQETINASRDLISAGTGDRVQYSASRLAEFRVELGRHHLELLDPVLREGYLLITEPLALR